MDKPQLTAIRQAYQAAKKKLADIGKRRLEVLRKDEHAEDEQKIARLRNNIGK